jgi:hypothetical protein
MAQDCCAHTPPMTTKANSPVVIVLASGRGERFVAAGGTGSKLKALLAGKPVLERTLDAVRASGLPWHVEDAGIRAWAIRLPPPCAPRPMRRAG